MRFHCSWQGHLCSRTEQGPMMEEHKKEIEADLDKAIQKGRSCGMEDSDLLELFHLLLEE